MSRKIGQKSEPTIPLRMAEILVVSVERLLGQLPDESKTTLEYFQCLSRANFMRELIEELKARDQ